MEQLYTAISNPLENMDCSFGGYLNRRRMMDMNRLDGNGIPNYAFALDYETRKKLDSINGFYSAAKTMTSTYVVQEMYDKNRTALAVGPNQFPEIYAIAKDCARILGIAIPNVFIENKGAYNAYTIASDDVEPIVVIDNNLRVHMTLKELKFIIGHECGHIQNYHSAYEYMSRLVLSAGTGMTASVSTFLANLLSVGSSVALSTWSRAAEVTADRAGMLCADSIEDCYSAISKLMYGGSILQQDSINYKAILEQLDETMGNIAKYDEILSSHPAASRRMKAIEQFSQCAVYYEWRPDQKKPGQVMRSKADTDERCKRYIDLTKKG
ncbi:MAG: M48 family metallopeptidase [Eubacteriales bacterium]|nr:M48 family metallopeptidase [Eubacteriales bacterium]